MANSSDDEPLSKKIKKIDSEDEMPLSKLRHKKEEDYSSCSEFDDSDKDSDYIGQCEHKRCPKEIVNSCDFCELFFFVKTIATLTNHVILLRKLRNPNLRRKKMWGRV